jgi:hypothetical protein
MIAAWIGFISALLLTLLGLAYLITLIVGFARFGMAFPPPAPVQLAAWFWLKL